MFALVLDTPLQFATRIQAIGAPVLIFRKLQKTSQWVIRIRGFIISPLISLPTKAHIFQVKDKFRIYSLPLEMILSSGVLKNSRKYKQLYVFVMNILLMLFEFTINVV